MSQSKLENTPKKENENEGLTKTIHIEDGM
jgi:hypothetical protein